VLKWFFWEQPSYWSHVCYNVQVFMNWRAVLSAGFQLGSHAHHVFSNCWLEQAHTHMHACTVLNTKDVYS